MDFKMADTSERRVFCNTILLKYHDVYCIIFLLYIFCLKYQGRTKSIIGKAVKKYIKNRGLEELYEEVE